MGWNLYRDLNDRGRLRVSCYMGSIVQPGVSIKKNLLFWNVTNVGRQPVMLTHVGGKYGKGDYFIVNTESPLPQMLKPGEYFIGWTDKALDIKERELKTLTAVDSLKKTYKVPWKQVRGVKQALQELKVDERSRD